MIKRFRSAGTCFFSRETLGTKAGGDQSSFTFKQRMPGKCRLPGSGVSKANKVWSLLFRSWKCRRRESHKPRSLWALLFCGFSHQWSPVTMETNALPLGNHRPGAKLLSWAAAAAAKSLQLCPTLCDPIDSLPPGSPVPGILQARTLEWVAISFSNAWKWKVKVKSLSHVRPQRPHGLQPTRLLRPWDFPSKSTGVGCHCFLHHLSYREDHSRG